MKDKTPSHLRDILDDQQEEYEDESGLPALRDNEFRVHGRASQKPLFAVHFIFPDGSVRTFQYMHLDSSSSYSPARIILRFTGSRIFDVLVEGRNLWKTYGYLHEHRLPWLRVATRDFAHDGEAIVTKVTIIDTAELIGGK